MELKYDKKKEEIKKYAKSVFLAYGFKKTTMDDIAIKAGLKKNTLYYYFENKEELFHEILKEDLEEIAARIEDAVSKCKTAEEKVYAYFKAFSNAYNKRSHIYTVDIKILLEFMIVFIKTHDNIYTKFDDILFNILKEGVKKREFVKHDIKETATLLLEINIAFEFRYMTELLIESSEEKRQDCCSASQMAMERTIAAILNGIKTKNNNVQKGHAR